MPRGASGRPRIPNHQRRLSFGGMYNNAHRATFGFERVADRLNDVSDILYALLYSGPDWNAAKFGRISGADFWRRMKAAIDTASGGVDAAAIAGVAKPELRVHRSALGNLAPLPPRSLSVDKPRNIAAALGMRSPLYAGAARLDRDLPVRELLP